MWFFFWRTKPYDKELWRRLPLDWKIAVYIVPFLIIFPWFWWSLNPVPLSRTPGVQAVCMILSLVIFLGFQFQLVGISSKIHKQMEKEGWKRDE